MPVHRRESDSSSLVEETKSISNIGESPERSTLTDPVMDQLDSLVRKESTEGSPEAQEQVAEETKDPQAKSKATKQKKKIKGDVLFEDTKYDV